MLAIVLLVAAVLAHVAVVAVVMIPALRREERAQSTGGMLERAWRLEVLVIACAVVLLAMELLVRW